MSRLAEKWIPRYSVEDFQKLAQEMRERRQNASHLTKPDVSTLLQLGRLTAFSEVLLAKKNNVLLCESVLNPM